MEVIKGPTLNYPPPPLLLKDAFVVSDPPDVSSGSLWCFSAPSAVQPHRGGRTLQPLLRLSVRWALEMHFSLPAGFPKL